MVEEGSEVRNEMAPQEETLKVPLTTDGNVHVEISPNDIPEAKKVEEEFKGLTKEELMQYASKPFWVRLRIFLMVLFWLSWVAMLVVAILIIVQAPRCAPPPSSTWLQKSPLLQLDESTKPEDATGLMAKLGITSLYIPSLISENNFYIFNGTYVSEKVYSILEAVSNASAHAVTDFVPSPIKSYNDWTQNNSYKDMYDPYTYDINFDNPAVVKELEKVLRHWDSDYGVSGFLVSSDEVENNPDIRNVTRDLNEALNPDIVIGESAFDMSPFIERLNVPGEFKEFVTQNFTDWPYFKFRPVSNSQSVEMMQAVTLAIMAMSGTPVLQVYPEDRQMFEANFTEIVAQCTELRESDAIKFGDTQFVVNTTHTLVAFTRTRKGTPGYAVAINLGGEEEQVDFSSVKFVPSSGTVSYQLNDQTSGKSKISLTDVKVAPESGIVLQFVAKY